MSATVMHGGRRLPLDADGISIGRRSDNGIVIHGDRVSRHHARIAVAEGNWYVSDLGSMNGTYVNGDRLSGESRWLESGDRIAVGGELLKFVAGESTRMGAPQTPALDAQVVQFAGRRMTFGRDESNDVVLRDPNVSRFHAEIVPTPAGVELRDLGSSNGTRLDGRTITRATLATGAEIAVGPFRILFDGTSFLARDQSGSLRLDAERVGIVAGKRRILASASLSVLPGELVAIIGESGSGKSTLIKALAGVTAPAEGRIAVNGEPVRARLTDIGYVPQDEIVHGSLTVAEALRYSARLRLPDDASDRDVEDAVARVLAEVDLAEHARTRIASLSGGQRKRAGVAVELLSRPSLLFLDEPTTGLDPELETRLMQLMRTLASSSRSVTVVTHATKNLGLCDKLAVMGRGGELVYFGSPDGALEFFGAECFDDIYRALRTRPAPEWRRQYAATEPAAAPVAPQPPLEATAPRRHAGRQVRVLASRYVRLLARDRRNLLILFGQVPLLALGMASLFKHSVFAHGEGHAGNSAQLLFLLVTTAIWLGSVDSARELVKERGVFVRETAAGVRLGAYLASKVAVLAGLAAGQTVALTAIVLILRPLHEPAAAYVQVGLIIAATGVVAVAMGLVISAVARSQDQATSFIPLALIPQLFFAGALVPVARMGEPISSLSAAIFAQWSFSGAGTVIDMNGRIAADAPFSRTSGYGTTFFDVSVPLACGTLALFALVMLVVAAAALRRHAE